MSDNPRTKTRPTGATASLGRTGFPGITSATGGEINTVTGVSQPGFNPLDLLYASLSACLAMSARIAAHQMGLQDRVERIEVRVSGEKASEGSSRVAGFNVTFTLQGDLDDALRQHIVEQAEAICTVSNTLQGKPQFDIHVTA
ncbi:putative OsmC-like protein [Pararhizobium capsulatum DSM 1112]|uniref:OsmC-like protein n=1 Tax=Pararhizobium capsulatum DSM 1112 TaxID=1121113 RepID=A0ABU0BLJ3_9HYPH|nr:OsmC family protein [Pararhizobium capsulatum]MDQ0319108.1 putative OsmC-like protein [Pararhizobium capsulatum DSM 1112]